MKAVISEAALEAVKERGQSDATGIRAILIQLRKESGLTQAQVADLMGVNRTSVTNMENGVQKISLEQLEKLADHLGLEVVVEVRKK